MLAALPQKVHVSIKLLRQTPPNWFLRAAKRHTCCCCLSKGAVFPTLNTRQRRRLNPLSKAGRTAVGLAEEPESDDFPPQSLTNFASGTPRRTSRTAEKPIVQKLQEQFKKGAANFVKPWKHSLQFLQLCAVVTLLIEVPAALAHVPSGGRVQQLTLLYLAFFGLGSVVRLWVHGKLAPRRQDAQVQTRKGVLSLIMFILLIVAGHWSSMAWYGYCLRHSITDYQHPAFQGVAAALLAGGFALHVWAATTLGKAYNRLVKPDKLVRHGPYAWCQHPIYTSYMMLFMGYALSLGACLPCLLFQRVCIQYYNGRTRKEALLLEEAFGNDYKVYAEHTGRFVPKFI